MVPGDPQGRETSHLPHCPTRALSPEAAAASWARRQRRRQRPGESGCPMLPTLAPSWNAAWTRAGAQPFMALPCPVRRWADNIHGLSPSPPRAHPMLSVPPRGHPCPHQQGRTSRLSLRTRAPPRGAAACGTLGSGRESTGQRAAFADCLSWARLDLPGFA